MYNVNATVPKTCVRLLLAILPLRRSTERSSQILHEPVATPVSPSQIEAKVKSPKRPNRIIGPYEVHDFYLYHFLHNAYSLPRYSSEVLQESYTPDQLKH